MGKQRIHAIGELMPGTEVEQQIVRQIGQLESSPISALKQQWRDLIGGEPPEFAKRSFLTQVIAWEVQAKAFGGLKPSLHRQLLQLASAGLASPSGESGPSLRKLSPGIKLIRTWRGKAHHVMVTEDGFLWQDRVFKSLSVIARKITGTQWSGPVFFGLKKSKLKQGNRTTGSMKLSDLGVAAAEVML